VATTAATAARAAVVAAATCRRRESATHPPTAPIRLGLRPLPPPQPPLRLGFAYIAYTVWAVRQGHFCMRLYAVYALVCEFKICIQKKNTTLAAGEKKKKNCESALDENARQLAAH
jgi:hypothetical protein